MTEASAGKGPAGTPPLSRTVPVLDLPGRGLDVTVTPDAAEREAVARSLGLVAIDALTGTFHVVRKGRVVRVTGEVAADVQQTCVVTLDAFPGSVREPVDVSFSEDAEAPAHEEVELTEAALDAPEPIIGNRIDLGALTVEFLALGLDPYPRKPGVAFEHEEDGSEEPSPFAALARLRDKPD